MRDISRSQFTLIESTDLRSQGTLLEASAYPTASAIEP